jgi:hypothetical protein
MIPKITLLLESRANIGRLFYLVLRLQIDLLRNNGAWIKMILLGSLKTGSLYC